MTIGTRLDARAMLASYADAPPDVRACVSEAMEAVLVTIRAHGFTVEVDDRAAEVEGVIYNFVAECNGLACTDGG